MSATLPRHMSADEFLVWAMAQPEGARYELVAGQVVAMAPERAIHGRIKGNVHFAFRLAIRDANLACETFVDRMAVRVDATTLYEPDVLVRCGAPVDDQALEVTDPLIVVEVVSPSSQKRDTGSKLEDYFRIPSVRHYLIIKTENTAIIHHQRDETGVITTAIVRDGTLRLDPPGMTVTNIFAAV